jgi:type VI secretion system protein ImpL
VGASGASVGMSNAVLRQFELAQRIRDKYFTPGTPSPLVNFSVTLDGMDATLNQFILEIDGDRFEYRHGPDRTRPARWPGPMPGTAAATFEDRASSRPNIAFSGPWAFFRLLDAAQVVRESDLRYRFQFEKSGFTAQGRIDAASALNPFGERELPQFRCEV